LLKISPRFFFLRFIGFFFLENSIFSFSFNSNIFSIRESASIGIVQNLTADHFVSSAYLRAHFRKEKGLPILVEKIVDNSPTISHTSIIALRNLAVDLKNKELIGKYGMREVSAHIPDAKQVKIIKIRILRKNQKFQKKN